LDKEDKENKIQQRSNLRYKGRLSGYVIVPDEVTYAGENLIHAEFRLWVILRKHARESDGIRHPAFPGRKRIARMMGLKSLNQITELIKSLEEKKVIKVEHRHLGKTNNYLVFDPPKKWAIDMKKLRRNPWNFRKPKIPSLRHFRCIQFLTGALSSSCCGRYSQKFSG